jgi:acyl carrier protein
MTTIAEKIQSFLAAELRHHAGGAGITADSRLIDDGLLDSLTLMHLLSFLEDSFGIVVAPEDIVPENFETIPLIAALVERTLTGATSVG